MVSTQLYHKYYSLNPTSIVYCQFLLTNSIYDFKLIQSIMCLYRTRGGRKLVDPQTYISCIEALKPDMFQAIVDGDTIQSSSGTTS